jgi:hypothetical protein
VSGGNVPRLRFGTIFSRIIWRWDTTARGPAYEILLGVGFGKAFKMNFEEFQNQSRLYVVGALEPWELDEFERAREKFGKKAEDFVTQCYALHEAVALSLRSLKASAAIKEQLMSMVRQRKHVTQPARAAAVALKGRTVRADSILSGITKPPSGAAQSCFLEQAIFAKQMTEKAEQETNRHVIKATRR